MRPRRDFGTLRKLPSGRYQVSYVGPDLKRHCAPSTFEAKDAAVAWLRNEHKLMESEALGEAEWSSPEERTIQRRRDSSQEAFETYARRWLSERRNSRGEPLRALTLKDYRQVLEDYLLPTFGHLRVRSITRSDVRAWYASLSNAGPRSRTKAYGLIRAILNSAVDDELITVSPVHIRGAGATTKKRALEPATPVELATIAEHMPARLRAAVAISAWCALRYGELAELRRKDIDMSNHRIRVRRAVVFLKGGPVVGPTKSEAGVRDVSIPPHVWPAVEEHLRSHVKRGADSLLFPGEAGGHMWHSSMNHYFGIAKRAAGRADLRWHDLRHTGATMAAQVGATTAELQARLGHSTSVAAQLYQHAAKDRDRQIAERLSRLVGGE